MSTATPSKHDRIERHIQRQRGAGVRSLATSFGFQFGLPPPSIPPESARSPSGEPPIKRRKSNESNPPEAGQAKPTTKPRRAFDTIEEEPECVRSSKLNDDRFVNTQVVVKKRGRPKKLTTEEGAAFAESTIESVAKRRGRKRAVAQDGDHQGQDMALAAARTAMGATSLHPDAFEAEPWSLEEPTAVIKRRGRPTKALVHDDEGVALAKHKATLTTGEPDERPKRRAATTAGTKVLDGYKEESSDITKKRREVLFTQRPRECAANEVQVKQQITPEEPQTAHRKPTIKSRRGGGGTSDPHACQNGKVDKVENDGAKRPEAADTRQKRRASIDMKPKPEPALLSGRPKRGAAVAAQAKVLSGYAEEATDITKRRREPSPVSRKRRVIPALGPAGTNIERNDDRSTGDKICSVEGQSILPAKRPRVNDGTNDTASGPVHVRQPLAEAEVNTRSISPKKGTGEGLEKQAKVRARSSHRTKAQEISKVLATKQRRARSIQVSCDASDEPAEVAKGCAEQVKTSPEPPAIKTELRLDESATVAPSLANAQTMGVKIKTARSKAPLKLARAQEPSPGRDDMEWLQAQPKAAKLTRSRKAPTGSRVRMISQPPDDMDLDDLLSNIASFVPRGMRHP